MQAPVEEGEAQIECRTEGRDVLLVSMPFGSVQQPNLGLSLLAAGLRRQGHGCDVRYFALTYVDFIGIERFALIGQERLYQALLGEWIFSGCVHIRPEAADLGYLGTVLRPYCSSAEWLALIHELIEVRRGAADFLEQCYAAVDWSRYALVGFSTSFQQTMASLGLARLVKHRRPEIEIVFGGANCEGELGLHLIENYSVIDAVCLGEGDLVFPSYLEGRLAAAAAGDFPGMAIRRNGDVVRPKDVAEPVKHMDDLPIPDFSDFFEQHEALPEVNGIYRPVASFETARGCWWGAKHHCTFCGLNGKTMAFRRKSADRAYSEIMHLAECYGDDLVAVDNILDMEYFASLLPRLAENPRRLTIHYEVKANLTAAQLLLMSRGGLKKIQPGIESLNSTILRLMRKGSTMLQNVQLLKLAAESGIYVEWGFLYGFPGECPEQYRQINHIVPLLHHLQPPSGFFRVRADRFSPYFTNPEDFGITLEPMPAYAFIYPGQGRSLAGFAYHYRIRSPETDAAETYTAETAIRISEWQEQHAESELCASDDGMNITLHRAVPGGSPYTRELDELASSLLRACATIKAEHQVVSELSYRWKAEEVRDALTDIIEEGVVLCEGNRYLSLALRQPGYKTAPAWEEIRAGRKRPYAISAPQAFC